MKDLTKWYLSIVDLLGHLKNSNRPWNSSVKRSGHLRNGTATRDTGSQRLFIFIASSFSSFSRFSFLELRSSSSTRTLNAVSPISLTTRCCQSTFPFPWMTSPRSLPYNPRTTDRAFLMARLASSPPSIRRSVIELTIALEIRLFMVAPTVQKNRSRSRDVSGTRQTARGLSVVFLIDDLRRCPDCVRSLRARHLVNLCTCDVGSVRMRVRAR